jgi:hypothetical protein
MPYDKPDPNDACANCNTYHGHKIIIRKPPGRWRSGCRDIEVPSLGLRATSTGTDGDRTALLSARAMIDRHLREHGHGPKEKTAKEREETRDEVFGRF